MSIVLDIITTLREQGIDRIDAVAILGSGMSGCFGEGEYRSLADHGSGVAGHVGRIGLLEHKGKLVMLGLGRRHLYEGYTALQVTELVRAAAGFGARMLLITNAAGGLNPLFRAGDIMLIEDCLGLMLGRIAAGEPGAVDNRSAVPPIGRVNGRMFATVLYDAIGAGALERRIRLHRGIYAAVTGPSYETRAEIRMLRKIGGDAVGMSTYLEAAAGARLGMQVVGMSLITNLLTDTRRLMLDHGDVVEQGRIGAVRMRAAIDAALAILL